MNTTEFRKNLDRAKPLGISVHGDYNGPLLIAQGLKSETRRRGKPRFKVGDLAYVAEPIYCAGEGWARYVSDVVPVVDVDMCWPVHWDWKPDFLAGRYMSKSLARRIVLIECVYQHRLGNICAGSCIAEGIRRYGNVYRWCDGGESYDTPQEAFLSVFGGLKGGEPDLDEIVTVYGFKTYAVRGVEKQ